MEFVTRSLTFLIIAASFGAVLALVSLYANLPTGWIGGLLLIGWTVYTRRKWSRLEDTTGLEPGPPERILRFYGAATAILFGHMIVGLAHPGIDLHVGSGNSLAIDSWTILAAMIVAGFLFRQDGKIKDERDAAISARGTKFGYAVLIAELIILSMVLGFLPPRLMETVSYFYLGNILIAGILFSVLMKYASQLMGYAKDTRAAIDMDYEK